MIILTHVNGVTRDKRYRYKTLAGAAKKARQLVGENPRLDPDGYPIVSRRDGTCLFVHGCAITDLFPELKP